MEKNCIFKIDASISENITLDDKGGIVSIRDLASNSDLKQFNIQKRPAYHENSVHFRASKNTYLESGHLNNMEVNEFCFYIVLQLDSLNEQAAQHIFSFKYGEGSKKSHAAIEFVWKRQLKSFYLSVRNKSGEEVASAVPHSKGRHLFFGGWKDGNVILKMDNLEPVLTSGADCELRDHRVLYVGDNYYHDPQFALTGQLFEISFYNKFCDNPDTQKTLIDKWNIKQKFFDKWGF